MHASQRLRNANGTTRPVYSYNFYRQPAWLQIMFKKMQVSVDRYCRIDKAGEIIFTTKHAPDVRAVQSVATSRKIFTELYGAPTYD